MRWTRTRARARACIRHHTSETPRHLGTSGCLRLPACLAPQGKLCGPRVGSRESPAAHAWAAGQVLQPTHTRRVASGQSPKPRCFGSHFRGFDVLLGAGRQSEVVSVLGVSRTTTHIARTPQQLHTARVSTGPRSGRNAAQRRCTGRSPHGQHAAARGACLLRLLFRPCPHLRSARTRGEASHTLRCPLGEPHRLARRVCPWAAARMKKHAIAETLALRTAR